MLSLKETESNYNFGFYISPICINQHPAPWCCVKLQPVKYSFVQFFHFFCYSAIPGYSALGALPRPAVQWSFPVQRVTEFQRQLI